MEDTQPKLKTHTVAARDLQEEIRRIPVFAQIKEADLDCLGEVEMVEAPAGEVVWRPGAANLYFWAVLEGELSLTKIEKDGTATLLGTLKAGDTIGEVPLLTGDTVLTVRVEAVTDARALRLNAEGFWRLMGTCPVVRAGVLENMARRLEARQVMTLHREKLVSLGTMAAGLMHELNNPGAAARRAASQLRENLTRLQEINLRFARTPLTPEQKECLHELQTEALKLQQPRTMGSLEESDAEERMSAWLERTGVENAWKIAPALVSMGWTSADLECAKAASSADFLSNSLNWLESLISSMQLVGTIEESVTRMTDLVMAVKKYAYDDKSREREIDIHDSIQSTLTILGHKLRSKGITVEKIFAAELPRIRTTGAGLSQVWTNLLDNAVDASPEGGQIVVRTWMEDGEVRIGIADQGPGIPTECQAHIFEPFFTTKPAGVGTGLGLDIAYRIVVGQFKGTIAFATEPGKTEFVVKLPSAG
jgi:signal transduction histidine kinase